MGEEAELIADRYEVLGHLGTGGMGTVLLARDQVLQRQVAIKRVHAGAGSDSARRIEREAKLGAGLTHPALVTILDTIVEGMNLLIVMEHVDGETLAQRVSRGPLTPDEALAVLRPVAAALDHAHEHGIVHRDVKPANVLLGERGAVKLADLGVALASDLSRITREHSLVGSLHYMAPEQLEPGGGATPASDIYALSAVAYEALSGRRAREGASPAELARVASSGRVPDLRVVAPDLPAAAATAVAAGLDPNPARRPATATELVERLEAALAPAPVAAVTSTMPVAAPAPTPAPTPAPASRATASRRGRPAALLGLLALVAVALALVAVVTGGADDPPSSRADAPEATAAAPAEEDGSAEATTAPEAEAEPVAADASTPEGVVRLFYESAAAGDLDAAWALAGPGMRAVFDDDRATFDGTFGTLESIRFNTLTAGSEGSEGIPVTVETVARHTDRTDRCSGELLAVPDGDGGYLVDGVSVSC